MFMMCVPLPCWDHVHIGFGNSLLASEGADVGGWCSFYLPALPQGGCLYCFRARLPPYIYKVGHRACWHLHGTR